MVRARQLDKVFTNVLGRGDMSFGGVPDKEMPHLRNHAREYWPPEFWMEEDVLRRQRMFFSLLAQWVKGVREADEKRGAALEHSTSHAREQFEQHARRLEASQARRRPTHPDPRKSGAAPTTDDPDLVRPPPPRQVRVEGRSLEERAELGKVPMEERIRRTHAHEKATDGEERWDPRWGDASEMENMPMPLPQGMKRLPEKDTPIDPAKQRYLAEHAERNRRATVAPKRESTRGDGKPLPERAQRARELYRAEDEQQGG